MKKHIIALILTSVFLISIPLFTVNINTTKSKKSSFNSDKEIKSGVSTEILAYEFKKEFCEEGLKAVAIILNSNYKSGVKLNTLSKSNFLKKFTDGERYYSLIEKTIEETGGRYITYKGKPVKIPCSFVTDGKCDSVYPYLRDTCNPADLINPHYTFNSSSGVSFNSINKLCKKGLSFEECLDRYFTDIKITAAKS
ncbi:MAG: hypothetical protein K6F88_07575 [Ruminococcus sp.]|nr:hypothetical protein [Ruminococcus sp.]